MNSAAWLPFLLAVFVVLPQGMAPARAKSSRKAPTIYIAGSAEYGGDPSKLSVRGASNLPPKSILTIKLYDFVGEGSHILGETTVQISADGFFETRVAAAPGEKFHSNIVCDIVFTPQYRHSQDASVLAVVGREGEFLGFPQNPQSQQHSGEYYLSEMIHVP